MNIILIIKEIDKDYEIKQKIVTINRAVKKAKEYYENKERLQGWV